MEKIEFDLKKIKKNDWMIFIEMLPYVSELIINYEVKGNVVIIEVEKNIENVKEKLDKLRIMLESISVPDNNLLDCIIKLDNSEVECINNKGVYKKLIELNEIVEIMPGSFVYSGNFLKIIKYFKKKIKEFLSNEFSEYNEINAPILLPLELYKKGGYFDDFPHHVMFQTALKNDIDIINEFSKNSNLVNNTISTKGAETVIKHAACAPIYSMLENKIVTKKESPLIYYVDSKCFRNESNNVHELERLNEFNMTEIVFVGTEEETRKNITRAKTLWEFWIDKFNLNCKIETANDSFFASRYKKLKYFQMIGKSKEEFKLQIPENGNYSAVSSINYHLTHFTKKYNIRSEDCYCCSSCIAFGLERLAYAFLSQKGLDVNKWDEETFSEIDKYIDLSEK